MPAAGSGYARGVNAGVARDELAMRFEDQQRRHKYEDKAIAGNNGTINPGGIDKADQLAIEMEEHSAQQEQRRQRVVLDKVLTKGIVSGDWDNANDALRANDLPMLQEYFQAEGIVGFHKFDPNDPKHVEMRNKFAQENYDTTYDELNQKDREEFDNNLVVYDKGAGRVELADKHELAIIGGLPERNTKVSKSVETEQAFMKRLAEQKQRVAQENLRVVNPSYSPLPAGENPEAQKNKLLTDFTTSVFPHLPQEARGPAYNAYYRQLFGEDAPQELLDSIVQPTSGEIKDKAQAGQANALAQLRTLEGDTERAKAFKAWVEAQDVANLKKSAASVGMSIEEFKAAFQSKEIRPVLDEQGQVTGAWEKIPESTGAPSAAQQKLELTDQINNDYKTLKQEVTEAGYDPLVPYSWPQEYQSRRDEIRNRQEQVIGTPNLTDLDQRTLSLILGSLSAAEEFAEEYSDETYGAWQEILGKAGQFFDWGKDANRVRPIKNQRFLALLLSNSMSPRGLNRSIIDAGADAFAAGEYRAGHYYIDGVLSGAKSIRSTIIGLKENDKGKNLIDADFLSGLLNQIDEIESGLQKIKKEGTEQERKARLEPTAGKANPRSLQE